MTKCKSLQPQGDIPIMDSNTSIGLSFTPGDACTLVLSDFKALLLLALCEL